MSRELVLQQLSRLSRCLGVNYDRICAELRAFPDEFMLAGMGPSTCGHAAPPDDYVVWWMGRGDRRTWRGKIFAGSYGKARPKRNARKPWQEMAMKLMPALGLPPTISDPDPIPIPEPPDASHLGMDWPAWQEELESQTAQHNVDGGNFSDDDGAFHRTAAESGEELGGWRGEDGGGLVPELPLDEEEAGTAGEWDSSEAPEPERSQDEGGAEEGMLEGAQDSSHAEPDSLRTLQQQQGEQGSGNESGGTQQ